MEKNNNKKNDAAVKTARKKKKNTAPEVYPPNDDRFVLFLDIMGFKERVNRVKINDLQKQLMLFITKIKDIKPQLYGGSKVDIQMAQFSDSIVLVTKNTETKHLDRICRAAAKIMQTGMETGFALRGAIAKGKMVFDERNQLFFGKALVDAYLLEEELGYYGIVFHESMEEIITQAKNEKIEIPIADTVVPLKKGKSRHYHVSWYELNNDMQIGSIKEDAIKWLDNLRGTVSGNPRVYLDNTINVIEEEEKKDTKSIKLYNSNTDNSNT